MEEGKAKKMLEDIEARHADIVRLEASVRELHQMFQDMALLVEEQVQYAGCLYCILRWVTMVPRYPWVITRPPQICWSWGLECQVASTKWGFDISKVSFCNSTFVYRAKKSTASNSMSS